jgi:hypothetical protein
MCAFGKHRWQSLGMGAGWTIQRCEHCRTGDWGTFKPPA